jgi:hypothetical protein
MKTWDKVKSPISFEEEKLKRAQHIFDEFKNFSTGYRVMFLIQRHKEGGEVNNTKLRKIITRNSDEWFEALKSLFDEQMSSELPMRIYSAVNERNFNKAIRQFKFEQLEADYYDQVQKENFYLDLKNRFVGCLMQPPQRATSLFLFDIDNIEGRDIDGEALQAIPNELIVKHYPTKNGWHLITKPFDYTKIKLPENCEMKKDALLLLSW